MLCNQLDTAFCPPSRLQGYIIHFVACSIFCHLLLRWYVKQLQFRFRFCVHSFWIQRKCLLPCSHIYLSRHVNEVSGGMWQAGGGDLGSTPCMLDEMHGHIYSRRGVEPRTYLDSLLCVKNIYVYLSAGILAIVSLIIAWLFVGLAGIQNPSSVLHIVQ